MTDRSVILAAMTRSDLPSRHGSRKPTKAKRRGASGVAATTAAAPRDGAAGAPVGRAARAAERRAAITAAAMDEFIARGYAATRLDDVARRAGVAKGTIYLHFKDKESLFEELIR